MRVGILALQGGVVEHARLVDALGHDAVLVRRPEQLADVGALILPGGESTALLRLADLTGLREPLKRAAGRLPTLGTCAGLIMLAALGVLDSMSSATPSAPRSTRRARTCSGRGAS